MNEWLVHKDSMEQTDEGSEINKLKTNNQTRENMLVTYSYLLDWTITWCRGFKAVMVTPKGPQE